MRLNIVAWTPEDACAIPLRRRDGSIRAFAWVDVADGSLVDRRWHWHTGYAACTEGGQRQFLHRAVLGLGAGDVRQADHRSRMRLDCRRANLRITDHDGNAQNRTPNRRCDSPYRGVRREGEYWQARVRDRRIGAFATELDAAKVAARARKRELPMSTEPTALLSGPDPIPARPRWEAFDAKARQVERWWHDGWTIPQIGTALGMGNPLSAGAMVQNMRRHGYDLPFRKLRQK